MTEPTFPQTMSAPWNEWQHVTQGGAVVRIRQVRTGGCAGGVWYTTPQGYEKWRRIPPAPEHVHYSVSVNGRRSDSFLTFEAALRKAEALVNG